MNNWKIAAALGWSLAGVALLAGAGGRDEMRVRRLVVEDATGRDLMVAGSYQGTPYLMFHDARNGHSRMMLSVSRGGIPSVTLSDGAGNEVLDVTGYADGPKVTYRVSGGKERTLP